MTHTLEYTIYCTQTENHESGVWQMMKHESIKNSVGPRSGYITARCIECSNQIAIDVRLAKSPE